MRTRQQKRGNRLLWQGKGKYSDFQESICVSRRRAQIHQSFLTIHIFPKPLITATAFPSSSHPRGTALTTKRITAAQPPPVAGRAVNYLPCLLAALPVLSPPGTASFTPPLAHSVPRTALLAVQLPEHTRCGSATQAPHCRAPGPASRHFHLSPKLWVRATAHPAAPTQLSSGNRVTHPASDTTLQHNPQKQPLKNHPLTLLCQSHFPRAPCNPP